MKKKKFTNKLLKEFNVKKEKDNILFGTLIIILLILALLIVNKLFFLTSIISVALIILIFIEFIRLKNLRTDYVEAIYVNSMSRIGNWNYFKEWVSKASSKKTYAFILFNINNFDSIPLVSDPDIKSECLREVGEILLSSIEEDETCCHIDYDDFSLYLHYQEPVDLLNRLKIINDDLVDGLATVVKQPNLLSIAWGIVLTCDKELVKNVSKAELARKKSMNIRTSSYGVYHEDMRNELSNFYDINKLLYQILTDHEFEVNYQPIINLEKRIVVKCSTSFIWKNNEMEEQINHYLKNYAQNQFLIEFDMLFFESVCRSVKEDIVYEISLHPITYASMQLPQNLKAYLKQYNIKPSTIELGISALDQNIPLNQYLVILNQLIEIGFKLNLIDYGTGNTIQLMNCLPIDCIKLSSELIRELGVNPKVSAMIKGLITKTKELNITIVIVGVDTVEQYNALEEFDIRYVQGDYFMGKGSAKKLEKYLLKLKNSSL